MRELQSSFLFILPSGSFTGPHSFYGQHWADGSGEVLWGYVGFHRVALSPLHHATCKPQEPLLLWVPASVSPTWVTPLSVPLPRNSLNIGRWAAGGLAPSVSIPQGLLCLFTQVLISSESFSFSFFFFCLFLLFQVEG